MSFRRKMKRQIAKNRMKREGYTKVNKHSRNDPSFFSMDWKYFYNKAVQK